jgi:CDGSH-type Zn-finger protein
MMSRGTMSPDQHWFDHEQEKQMDKPKIAGRSPVIMDLDPGTYHCCACGLSKNQPFCDGSHRGTTLTPVTLTIDERRRVALCLCKQSGDLPLCDGSHKTLPEDDG